MKNFILAIKVFIPLSPYLLKTVFYAVIAITTYYQIEYKELKAPDDILALVDGPLGRAAVSVAVVETLHNLFTFGKKLRKKMVPDSH